MLTLEQINKDNENMKTLKDAGLVWSAYGSACTGVVTVIEGNTYPFRNALKAIGARYKNRSWTLKGTLTYTQIEQLTKGL